MWVLASCLRTFDGFACRSIDTNGSFTAHISAEPPFTHLPSLCAYDLEVRNATEIGLDRYGSSRYRYRHRYLFLADIFADTDIFGLSYQLPIFYLNRYFNRYLISTNIFEIKLFGVATILGIFLTVVHKTPEGIARQT